MTLFNYSALRCFCIRSGSFLLLLQLTCCSTPPREPWQPIRECGLIPVIRATHHQHLSEKSAAGGKSPSRQLSYHGKRSLEAQKDPISIPPKNIGRHPTGLLVPGKHRRGYAFSPFTTPPRIIDVRGFPMHSQIRCPYSKKIFVIPAEAVAQNSSQNQTRMRLPKVSKKLASSLKSSPEATGVRPKTQRPTIREKTTASGARVSGLPKKPEPKKPATKKLQLLPAIPSSRAHPALSKKAESSSLAKRTEIKAPSETPSAKIPDKPFTTKTPESLPPYGKNIPNKPGFVYSPFAQKHQLVSVEGLAPGIAVRCPYTRKIFRIPEQHAPETRALNTDQGNSNRNPKSPEETDSPGKPIKKP